MKNSIQCKLLIILTFAYSAILLRLPQYHTKVSDDVNFSSIKLNEMSSCTLLDGIP